MDPQRCPICAGSQQVSKWLYDHSQENYLYFRDKAAHPVPPQDLVDCRSCQGTGLVWAMTPEQRSNIDLVTGLTGSISRDESELWCGLDPTTYFVEPDIHDLGGIALGTVDLKPSSNLLIYHAADGSEFSLRDCHIEVGDMGGGIHVIGDLDSSKTIIEGNYIERVEGLQGIRIHPRVPEVHPERKRVLDLLATLPEDMPLLVLTPQSVVEIDTAKDYRAQMKGGSVQQRGVEALVARMNDYQGSRGKYPLEVSPRLAGLPVTEGDE